MTSRETITLDARAQQRLIVLPHVRAGELTLDRVAVSSRRAFAITRSAVIASRMTSTRAATTRTRRLDPLLGGLDAGGKRARRNRDSDLSEDDPASGRKPVERNCGHSDQN